MDSHVLQQGSLLLDADTPTMRCAECGQEKSLDQMGRNRRTGQITDLCKKCRRRMLKLQSYANPANRDTWRNRHLMQAYGMTVETYKAMFAAQGGVCAICGLAETRKGGRYGNTLMSLVVDHDHATGKVRALLCHPCNQGIGSLRESPDLLRRAAAYIEAHTAQAEVVP